MKNRMNTSAFRRAAVSMLTLIMVISCLPLINQPVSADDREMVKISREQADRIGAEWSEGLAVTKEDAAKLGIDADGNDMFTDGLKLEQEDLDAELSPEDPCGVDIERIPVQRPGNGLSLKGEDYTAGEDGYEQDDEKFGAFDGSAEYPEISVGETVKHDFGQGEIVTLLFKASDDANYFFYSTSDEDTYGRVVKYDAASGSFRQIVHNDDRSSTDNDFHVAFKAEAGAVYGLQARMYFDDRTGSVELKLERDPFDATFTVDDSNNKSSGKITVSGTVTGDSFDDVYVDGSRCYLGIDGQTSFSKELNMKDYPVGIHSVCVKFNEHEDEAFDIYYEYGVPTYIYGSQKPTIKTEYFTTGPKYLQYYYGGSSLSQDSSCGVFLDYRKKGGSWTTCATSSTSSYSPDTVSKKLTPQKTYQVRTYFGKKGTYNGETYFIKGPYSSTKSLKTGNSKKLAIKSISTTKAKVKYSGWTFTPYYYGVPGTPVPIYYTTFKMTITLKKKPGTTGIMRDNNYLKGNKKKYTEKCSWSGGKNAYKGHKIKCAFKSYQSKTYGGYSPVLNKKVKIK